MFDDDGDRWSADSEVSTLFPKETWYTNVHAFLSSVYELYKLSEHCHFGELKDEYIWDWTVIRLRDKSLSEKLQLKGKLTLTRAISMARSHKNSEQSESKLEEFTFSQQNRGTERKNSSGRQRKGQSDI